MAGWWDRHVVPRLIGCCCAQPAIMNARHAVVPQAQGDVLELGCGGGINLPLYDRNRVASLTGIDPSPELLDRTRAAAQASGVPMQIVAGRGEALPFSDAQFDTVLATFTMCSVDSPGQVLRELRRVLKPGGRVLFLEHGAAPDAAPARWQRRIEPIWKRLAGNCHLTRQASGQYRNAGFAVDGDARYLPDTPRVFGWIEWGSAHAVN
jgi:ubiquinone/menaquinone biosynthesis C-methylase UbiE